MKNIKHLALVALTFVFTLYSCSDDNPIENEIETTNSVALRTVLNQVKIDNSSSTSSSFYDFVYPLTLSYNNGTEVSVASRSGLTNLLASETANLFIQGISFPFQVSLASDNSTVSINNESEFNQLNNSFDFTTINEVVFSSCFNLIYPVTVIDGNGNSIVVNSENELLALLPSQGSTGNYQLDFVFPISVDQNGATVVIGDIYELFQLLTDCVGATCVCSTDIDPVCVDTGFGIVQYDNACLAECDGFTSADFVTCVETFDQQLGTCFTIAYPVDVTVQGTTTLTVNSDAELLMYYSLGTTVPDLVYPIDVTFISQSPAVTLTMNDQAAFEAAIDANCN